MHDEVTNASRRGPEQHQDDELDLSTLPAPQPQEPTEIPDYTDVQLRQMSYEELVAVAKIVGTRVKTLRALQKRVVLAISEAKQAKRRG